MTGVVDAGMGNLLSVCNALGALREEFVLCRDGEDLHDVERIVLPGVGAIGSYIRELDRRGLRDVLVALVERQRVPILGICLGMQVMARRSFEFGEHEAFGWFQADVVRLQPRDRALRVPHVGWNGISFRPDSPLFAGLPQGADVYFVHSYHMQFDGPEHVEATCDYGGSVTAAVRRDNVFGTQFHPEKSQEYGLRVLENFIHWTP